MEQPFFTTSVEASQTEELTTGNLMQDVDVETALLVDDFRSSWAQLFYAKMDLLKVIKLQQGVRV